MVTKRSDQFNVPQGCEGIILFDMDGVLSQATSDAGRAAFDELYLSARKVPEHAEKMPEPDPKKIQKPKPW